MPQPEAHIFHAGRFIRLSDEPIEDYVAEVNLVRSLHEAEGFSPDGLGNLAQDLRVISDNTTDRIFDSEADLNRGASAWPVLLELGLESKGAGKDFVNAYVYNRVNRFLAAEFGSAETVSTVALRGIANEVVKRNSAGPTDQVQEFFDIQFSGKILDEIFPEVGSRDVHPRLAKLFKQVEKFKQPYYDPALARIISTLIARECSVVVDIPAEVREGVLMLSRSMFKDTGLHTKKPKLNIVKWDIGDNEEDTQSEPESDLYVVPPESDQDEEIRNTNPQLTEYFKPEDGNCFVTRTPEMTNEEYRTRTRFMSWTMFPHDGKGVIAAKEVCRGCSVQGGCLQFALDNKIDHGVWGGTSERERRNMLRAIRQSTIQAIPETEIEPEPLLEDAS